MEDARGNARESAAAAEADVVAREGCDCHQYSSAEEAGGSSMSVPPEPTGRGPAQWRGHNSREKRGGRGGRSD
eukprot:11600816-Karenia_brevis.AAC.1